MRRSVVKKAVASRSVGQLVRTASAASDLGSRVELISRSLLGLPFQNAPLVGSAEIPERLVTTLDAFDCVTFVETVLAAALARTESDFIPTLMRLRYEDGVSVWKKRNHYMTDWIRNNRRSVLVRDVALGSRQIEKRRLLDVVPGLPRRTKQFRCLPKRFVRGVVSRLRTGDLICFASTRTNVDVFHCGLVVKHGIGFDRDAGVSMRHASRTQGGVVEQDLFDFLATNRMAGVIVARPVEQEGS